MKKKATEGEVYWAIFATFQRAGYSANTCREISQRLTDGKDSVIPPLTTPPKRPIPQLFREYLRPFIKNESGDEQVEIDMDAIIQYLEDN